MRSLCYHISSTTSNCLIITNHAYIRGRWCAAALSLSCVAKWSMNIININKAVTSSLLPKVQVFNSVYYSFIHLLFYGAATSLYRNILSNIIFSRLNLKSFSDEFPLISLVLPSSLLLPLALPYPLSMNTSYQMP